MASVPFGEEWLEQKHITWFQKSATFSITRIDVNYNASQNGRRTEIEISPARAGATLTLALSLAGRGDRKKARDGKCPDMRY
jgi:hypothetical protein